MNFDLGKFGCLMFSLFVCFIVLLVNFGKNVCTIREELIIKFDSNN